MGRLSFKKHVSSTRIYVIKIMTKLYYYLIGFLFLTNSQLFCQYKPLTKEQLNLKFHYALGNGDDLADFYESNLPNDTVFCLEISYEGFESYLLNCFDAPIFKYVQELQIHGCFRDIPVAITKLKNLTSLYVDNHCDGWCEHECSIHIPNEIYRLPNLELLSISNKNISISDSIVNLKKLRHLNISSVSLLPILFTDMPQLKSIGLNDVYTSNKELHKIVLNKLLVFSHYPKASYYLMYNEFGINYDSIESKLTATVSLNKKIDLKIKNPQYKNEIVFKMKGEIKNNKAEGEWLIKTNYTLRANYISGIKQNSTIALNDTIIISRVTREQNGIENEIDRYWERKSKNNIPIGTWKYGNYMGNCYYKINFDTAQSLNFNNADTLSFYSWKEYKNGKENGIWKEYSGYDKTIIQFEDGKIKQKVLFDYRFSTPTILKEYKYQPDEKLKITNFYRGNNFKLFKYSEENYNNYEPNGAFTKYFNNGDINSIKIYESGRLIGDEIEYFDNKQISRIKTYENGYLIHEVFYHFNGKKEYETHSNKYGIHGTVNRWNEEGKLIETMYYENGKPFGVAKKFDKNGNVTFERYYENGIEIYNEEQGFDDKFIFNDYIMIQYESLKFRKTCCRYSSCRLQKKIINDSVSLITEHQYSDLPDKHLIYIKEFRIKNYKLDGLQIIKDSAGNIIESVIYKNGMIDGALKIKNIWGNFLTMKYTNNILQDTVLTYDFWHGKRQRELFYKNKRLYKAYTYDGDTLLGKEISYYYKHRVRDYRSGFFYIIPEKVVWIDSTGKIFRTMIFHGKMIKELDDWLFSNIKGYVIVDGKRISLEKNMVYRNIFIDQCIQDIFGD